jgi:hypothetical protein
MTQNEFGTVISVLQAGCAAAKRLSEESLDVYFHLLGDLPVDVFRAAALRVLLQHPWSTFPSIAELRQAASEIMRQVVVELQPVEAWEMAYRAARSLDPELIWRPWMRRNPKTGQMRQYPSQFEAVTAGYPPIVIAAMRAFGVTSLCSSKEPLGVIRAQFMRAYEQLVERDQRVALLPEALKTIIASIGVERKEAGRIAQQCEAPPLKVVSAIGAMPDVAIDEAGAA